MSDTQHPIKNFIIEKSFFLIEVFSYLEEMEQVPMVKGQAQAEDWDVEAVEAGWEEHAREQGPAEVASAPIVALGFHTK